ncbi:hypothetical protein HK407_04g07010 [Ordospora pajunii]|uniref:uncharacterized protein n=1 Tax=Ordospora pajunii TaxID=3039483 RepID=UPI0029526867|nr:uncharacterized protein HK407_04g07010 [Ordospora pajunii]KAH9411596.1 hypothetical protein HK407_04g07010 [Ordospora pajunii]
MVLVIDVFRVPGEFVLQELFGKMAMKELNGGVEQMITEILADNGVYVIHKETMDEEEMRWLRYYSNEVVEVLTEMNVQYVNKSKKVVKYYYVTRDSMGRCKRLVEVDEGSAEKKEMHDKTSYLPYIEAQCEEEVIFPDDE